MRLLRIVDAGQGGAGVELHPHLTVVRGLDGPPRQRLLDGLASLPRGAAVHLSGELEAHGIHLDLSNESLGMLDLPAEVQMVISASDLPGAGGDSREALLRRDLQVDRERVVDELAVARAAASAAEAEADAVTDALAEAGSADPEATAAATLADAEALVVTADLSAGAAEHALTAAELELAGPGGSGADPAVVAAQLAFQEAAAALDPEAESALLTAESEVAAADAALAAVDAEDPTPQVAAPSPYAFDLLDRRAELQRRLAQPVEGDAPVVAEALARATAVNGDHDRAPRARMLADEWERLAIPSGATGLDRRLGGREARLGSTEGSSALTADDVEEIERVHVHVLEAQERSEARFGGGKAKRRLAAARDAEQEVLDRMGFSTYAEFMMSTARMVTAPPVAPDADESDVDDLTAPPPNAAEETRRAALEAEIAHLLGHPVDGDPSADLRAIEPGPDPSVELRHALSGVGMALEDTDFQPDTLIALARVWLSEQAESDAGRAALAADLASIQAELASLGLHEDPRLVEAAASPDDDVDPVARREAVEERFLAASIAFDTATARHLAHLDAVAEVSRRQHDLQVAQAAASEAAERAAGQQTELAAAVEAARAALAEARAEQARATDALAVLEAARHDGAGPVDPRPALAARLAEVTADLAAATSSAQSLEQQKGALDHRIDELAEAEARAMEARAESSLSDEQFEAIEWYLLSCMAEHRRVSLAGSLPLVLDDVFRGLPVEPVLRLLDAIERLASAVQVVVLSDDDDLAKWATDLGEARAAVVQGA